MTTTGAAFHAVTDARCVAVTGADRARYLEDVTTQHVTELAPGDVVGALHLDPHGAPLAMFDVLVGADTVTLVAPDADVAAFLVERLGSRTFLLDARFAPTDDVVVAVRGDAAAVRTAVAAATAPAPLPMVERADGTDLVVPPEALDRVRGALDAAGVRAVDAADLEDARVRAGRPAWGREVRAPHLPEEAGVLPTHVHLAKGCYPGQEAVARMWMLGRPRRRLVTAHAEGAGAPGGDGDGTGDATPSTLDVTSSTRDGRDVLGYGPAGTAVGDRVLLGDRTAVVTGVVGDAMPPGHDPAVRRRRDRVAAAAGPQSASSASSAASSAARSTA